MDPMSKVTLFKVEPMMLLAGVILVWYVMLV